MSEAPVKVEWTTEQFLQLLAEAEAEGRRWAIKALDALATQLRDQYGREPFHGIEYINGVEAASAHLESLLSEVDP